MSRHEEIKAALYAFAKHDAVCAARLEGALLAAEARWEHAQRVGDPDAPDKIKRLEDALKTAERLVIEAERRRDVAEDALRRERNAGVSARELERFADELVRTVTRTPDGAVEWVHEPNGRTVQFRARSHGALLDVGEAIAVSAWELCDDPRRAAFAVFNAFVSCMRGVREGRPQRPRRGLEPFNPRERPFGDPYGRRS